MKTCPFCAESIQDAAVVCRFCGRDLSLTATPVHPPPTATPTRSLWRDPYARATFALVALVALGSLMGSFRPASESRTMTPTSSTVRRASAAVTRAPHLELLASSGQPSASGQYLYVDGQVRNVSSEPIDNVLVVVSWYAKDGTFVTSDSAVIEYRPLLPGQTSPFKTMTRRNPEMARYVVEFTSRGSVLTTLDRRRP